MVITLIPEPAVVIDLNKHMAEQRFAAVHAKLLREIGLH
jgi:hypothetical protein